MKPFEHLPKNKQLILQLKKELDKRQGQDHALFFTEAEISETYQVSRTTIRQAIEQLVQEGLLYRIQGKGTFIAPKKHRVSIILVVETMGDIRSGCYPQIDFYHGLQQYAKDTQVNVELLNSDEFNEIKRDIGLIYKGVDKVIFFRTSQAFFESRAELAKNGYTTLFYGSDSHFSHYNFSAEQGLANEYFFLYQEADILKLAFEQIVKRGLTRVGIAYSGKTVRFNRFHLIKEAIERNGLNFADQCSLEFDVELDDLASRTEESINHLQPHLDNLPEVIFSTDDWLVPPIYHALAKLGKTVKQDIAIISINNYPFAEYMYPSLSTIDIPIYRDARTCAALLIDEPAEQKVYFGAPSFIERESI